MSDSHKLQAIDLFCGCGGIAAGLRAAGFQVMAGVDIEPRYIATFAHNFPSAKTCLLDLSSLPPSDFAAMLNLKRGRLDLLSGGPPCQGFSKNVPRRARHFEDTNNLLVRAFLDYCEFLMPRFVLMENVAEMRNGFGQAYTNEVFQRLEKLGYSVSHAVLNAADYGVPQRRRRAFFIAHRDGGTPAFPGASHTKMNLLTTRNHVTVWEAIGDLPSLEHGKDANQYALTPFSDFQKTMRNGNQTVANHVARKLQPTQYERLASLTPGQTMKDLPAHLQTKGGYSGAYGRLTKEMIAPTITRWVFHPGSGRWGHPVDTRLLTMREAARLQSFPDDFEFVGSYIQQAGQIGNAVPPLLAQRIAENLLAST